MKIKINPNAKIKPVSSRIHQIAGDALMSLEHEATSFDGEFYYFEVTYSLVDPVAKVKLMVDKKFVTILGAET